MNQIELLKKTWKAGMALLVAIVLAFGGFFLNLSAADAHGNPNMTANLRVNDINDSPDVGWVDAINTQAGHQLQFDVELHNTVVGTSAHDVTAKINFSSSTATSVPVTLNVTTTNSNGASDTNTVNITQPAAGGKLVYVPGSSRLTWDQDGDGTLDFNNATLTDDIISGNGVRIGNQSGCNEFIIKIGFLVNVEGAVTPPPTPTPTPSPSPSPSPTPTPQPSPSPTPTPPAGGDTNTNTNTNTNTQNQSQTQNNNQNVTINQTVNNPAVTTAQVAGAKTVVKQPETGVGVLGMVSMFSAVPVGLMLARYRRNRLMDPDSGEEIGKFAKRIHSARTSKTA